MQENIDNAIQWVKNQPDINGCITGSTVLGYFEGQDIDIFVYDQSSFFKLLFAMHYSNDFHILDPLDKWKFNRAISNKDDLFKSFGMTTIKFMYNTCVPVNVIIKNGKKDIFSVLASFDMDIISKGYDLLTGKTLDLTDGSQETKIASFNKWNPVFYSTEIWQMARVLRQLIRCFKYHDRGYNTDAVVLKYIELIDKVQKEQSIFSSESYNETLKIRKQNTKLMKEICLKWLETHKVTKEELELLEIKLKEI